MSENRWVLNANHRRDDEFVEPLVRWANEQGWKAQDISLQEPFEVVRSVDGRYLATFAEFIRGADGCTEVCSGEHMAVRIRQDVPVTSMPPVEPR